jgi:L-ascorbate oxidase
VAADGLTRGQAFEKITDNLQPGYRSDILFVLPEDGEYCVYDDAVPAAGSVSAQPENAKVLAILRAGGGGKVVDQTVFVTEQLIKAAGGLPPDVRNEVRNDLRTLKLTRFVPHAAITEQEVAASGLPVVPIEFNIAGSPFQFMVNGQPYDPSRIDQTLLLGKTQAWRLSSANASHPFHIHVNPFQIVSVRKKGPDGQPIGPEITDGQYTGMLGTWKDTIFVQPDVVIGTRTRYERYIGEFVLHCHILDHEDQGMMQNVQIVLPDGQGKPTSKGHH